MTRCGVRAAEHRSPGAGPVDTTVFTATSFKARAVSNIVSVQRVAITRAYQGCNGVADDSAVMIGNARTIAR
jgi:hypothetical protein